MLNTEHVKELAADIKRAKAAQRQRECRARKAAAAAEAAAIAGRPVRRFIVVSEPTPDELARFGNLMEAR